MLIQQLKKKGRYLQFLACGDLLLSDIYPMFPTIAVNHFSTEAEMSFMLTVNPFSEKDVLCSANPCEQHHSDQGLKILVPYEEAVTGIEYEFLKLCFIFPLCAINQ